MFSISAGKSLAVNRVAGFLFVLFFAVSSLTGCAGYRDIRITSCDVENISPKGMRAVAVTLNVGFFNPAKTVRIDGFSGEIYREGESFGHLLADDFVVIGHSSEDVRVKADVSLAESVGFVEVLKMISSFDVSDFTVDISFRVKSGGLSRKVKIKDIPMADLVKMTEYETY